MAHFTNEQLVELEVVFGLNRKEDTLPVCDGWISKYAPVWWRAKGGPEKVLANGKHWQNIKDFSHLYQIKEPQTIITYKD